MEPSLLDDEAVEEEEGKAHSSKLLVISKRVLLKSCFGPLDKAYIQGLMDCSFGFPDPYTYPASGLGKADTVTA